MNTINHVPKAHADPCHYEPDVYLTVFDKNGNEIGTSEADPDENLEWHCSACNWRMHHDWFNLVEGPYGGQVIKETNFNYCPGCGRRVVTGEPA